MATQNIGALEFDVVMKNGDIEKQVEQLRTAINGIAKSADNAGKSTDNIGDNFDKTAKKSVQSLESAMNALDELNKKNISVQPVRLNFDDLQRQCEKLADVGDESLNKLSESSRKNQAEIDKLVNRYEILDKTIKATGNNPDAAQTQRLANLKLEIKRRQELGQEITKQYNLVKNTSLDGEIKLIQNALEKMSKAGLESTNVFKQLTAKVKVLKDAKVDEPMKKASESLEDYTDNIYDATIGQTKFGASLKNLVTSGKGIDGVFDKMGVAAKSLGKTLLGLMSNPVFLAIGGVAAAGAAFKWWYDYNKGVEQATRLTQNLTGLTGSDLTNFRAEVQAVADTFGKDFDEVLESTNAVAKQMGISVQDAMKVVKDGFVMGADSNGEFLDILKEYPAYFKEAGLSAEEFVAITTQGVKNGVFSDKAVDTIKEANLRLREMPTATQQAIDGIGLSSKAMMDALKNNETTTFELMQQISARMAELPPQASEVGTAIADIFGGPGEDAGLQFITSLSTINGNLDTMKDNAGNIVSLQDDMLQSNIELEQKVAEVFDSTGGFFESLKTNGKIFLNDILIGIIDGIESLYNWFVDLWNESDALRANIVTFGVVFKNVFKTAWELVKAVGGEIGGVGDMLIGVFTFDTDRISKGFDKFIDANKEFGSNVMDIWSSTFDDIEDGVNARLDRIGDKTAETSNEIGASMAAKLKEWQDQLDAENKKTSDNGDGDKQKTKTLKDVLSERKKLYDDYEKAINSTDSEISSSAQKSSKELLKSGETWEQYLKNLRVKYKDNANAIKQINAELLALQKESVMDLWQNQINNNANLGQSAAEQLAAFNKARQNIANDDPLKNMKTEWIDDQIKELVKTSESDYIDAQKTQRDFADSSLKDWEKYEIELASINKQIAATQNADELKILNNEKYATETKLAVAKNKERVEQEKQLTEKIIAIELDRQKQIADIQNDTSLDSATKDEQIAKIQKYAENDIKIARSEFADVDGDFVQTMLTDMQSVMGQQMDYYVTAIAKLRQQLNGMDANSPEYAQLNGQLQSLEQNYERLKTKSLASTKKMAKDKALTTINDTLSEFGNQLKNIGSEIGGVSGDVISATGEMFNGVVSITQSVTKFAEINTQAIEGVSAAGVTAIKTVEKASVILAIIGTIMQLIQAVQNIGSDNNAAEWDNEVKELSNSLKEAKEAADIEELRNSNNSLFGDDAWGTLITNIEIARDATEQFTAAQKEMIDTFNSYDTVTEAMFNINQFGSAALNGSAKSIEDVIGSMQVKTKDAKKFLGIGSSAKYASLSSVAPDLFNNDGSLNYNALEEFANSDTFSKLSDENQTLITNLIEQWNDYNDAIEQVEENFKSMFSDLGSSVMDSMVEMFEGSEDAMDDFNGAWDDMIENMIESMLYSNMIQPEIEKLTEQLKKDNFFADPTTNIETAITDIAAAKDAIYAKKDSIATALQSFSDLGDANGLNLFKSDSDDTSSDTSTLSGAIKGASQESIDLLAGQTNAVRMNQVEQLALIKQQIIGITDINSSIIANGLILREILSAVKQTNNSNLRAQGLEI